MEKNSKIINKIKTLLSIKPTLTQNLSQTLTDIDKFAKETHKKIDEIQRKNIWETFFSNTLRQKDYTDCEKLFKEFISPVGHSEWPPFDKVIETAKKITREHTELLQIIDPNSLKIIVAPQTIDETLAHIILEKSHKKDKTDVLSSKNTLKEDVISIVKNFHNPDNQDNLKPNASFIVGLVGNKISDNNDNSKPKGTTLREVFDNIQKDISQKMRFLTPLEYLLYQIDKEKEGGKTFLHATNRDSILLAQTSKDNPPHISFSVQSPDTNINKKEKQTLSQSPVLAWEKIYKKEPKPCTNQEFLKRTDILQKEYEKCKKFFDTYLNNKNLNWPSFDEVIETVEKKMTGKLNSLLNFTDDLRILVIPQSITQNEEQDILKQLHESNKINVPVLANYTLASETDKIIKDFYKEIKPQDNQQKTGFRIVLAGRRTPQVTDRIEDTLGKAYENIKDLIGKEQFLTPLEYSLYQTIQPTKEKGKTFLHASNKNSIPLAQTMGTNKSNIYHDFYIKSPNTPIGYYDKEQLRKSIISERIE